MSNFIFLEKINPNLANLAYTAEKLFRDEYFDQCIIQTRKMAELMTKNILGSNVQNNDSFDNMLYKLKSISNHNFKEQEFISDMYFIKKLGNISVHSEFSLNDKNLALECLEHIFEASINYAYALTHNEQINRLLFDEKLISRIDNITLLQKQNLPVNNKNLDNTSNDISKNTINKKTNNNEKKSFNIDFNINSQNNYFYIIKKLVKILPITILTFIIVSFIILKILPKFNILQVFHYKKQTIIQEKTIKNYKNNNYSMTNTFSKIK